MSPLDQFESCKTQIENCETYVHTTKLGQRVVEQWCRELGGRRRPNLVTETSPSIENHAYQFPSDFVFHIREARKEESQR